jgi:uncharacterized protein YoaH (UPF0181 family)
MSYGSNEAVEDAEDSYHEDCTDLIAQKAAELVAAGDMGRDEAIEVAAEWLRQEREADNDETGVAAVECKEPMPSKPRPHYQVAAIKAELLESAEAAAVNISQPD